MRIYAQAGALASVLLTATAIGQVQAPSAAQVHAAANSVYKVWGRGCSARGRPTDDRFGTAFVVEKDSAPYLVTALHVVAGCSRVTVEDHAQNEVATTLAKVYSPADLALVQRPAGIGGTPLRIAQQDASAGQPVAALGFGETGTFLSKSFPVRLSQGAIPGANTIANLVPGAVLADLQRQGFPNPFARIVDLDGALLHGDSGCPILDGNGEVTAIGNGGTMGGALPISWGFPASTISLLFASGETAPTGAKLIPALHASKLSTGQFSAAVANAGSSTVQCGAQSFQLVGRRSFDQVLHSADALSVQHVGLAQAYAAQVSKPLLPTDQFNVYVSLRSGAVIVTPGDVLLTSVGSDCVAISEDDVELRYTSLFEPSVAAATPETTIFVSRSVHPGEFVFPNPMFTMPLPVTRADGMVVQRTAVFISEGAPIQNEAYITHAFRNGTYLGALVRTITPQPAMRPTMFYRAVAAVYLSAFAI